MKPEWEQEIEGKILDINPDRIKEKLNQRRAHRAFSGTVIITEYDSAERYLQSKGKILRVTTMLTEGEKEGLTYITDKQIMNRQGIKRARLYSSMIMDWENEEKKILEKGYAPVLQCELERQAFTLMDSRFEINTLQKRTSWLDIEAEREETIYAWAQEFGFTRNDIKPWTIEEILGHYKYDARPK